jgi:hypothetical protein
MSRAAFPGSRTGHREEWRRILFLASGDDPQKLVGQRALQL